MNLQDVARDLAARVTELAGQLVWGGQKHITVSLSERETRALLRALDRYAVGDDGWQSIESVPTDRQYEVWDNEMSDTVSLARAADDHAPLFFLYQERVDGVYELTKWRSLVEWPRPPRSRSEAELVVLVGNDHRS